MDQWVWNRGISIIYTLTALNTNNLAPFNARSSNVILVRAIAIEAGEEMVNFTIARYKGTILMFD